ncbi:hypothetical protein GCM10007036_15050 [Alsobacter metallidurans]|uniref:DUF6894 domain-containing protein n=1 Tax=Alsobacter metallidurans TaxID=340221 RepID=A0A917MH47_9HYPH|nr:hypothetical protein [Alsobacter metallidurans]GGH15212.1 hypothetical protein GCM10007036_15050 [Alsobacter metallidurans]
MSYDQVGLEFNDLATARDEAVKGAREIIAEAAKLGQSASDCEFVFCDQAGQVVLQVPFASTLSASEDHPMRSPASPLSSSGDRSA